MAIEISTFKINGRYLRITMSYGGGETNPLAPESESVPRSSGLDWIPEERPAWRPWQLYNKLQHFSLVENLAVGIIGAQGTEPDGLQAGKQGDRR